jgi:hypothetical protein
VRALTGRSSRGDREEVEEPGSEDSIDSDDSADQNDNQNEDSKYKNTDTINSRTHRRSQSHLSNTAFVGESAAYALRCSEMARLHNNREECLRRVIQAQKHLNEKQRDERNKLMQEVKRVRNLL